MKPTSTLLRSVVAVALFVVALPVFCADTAIWARGAVALPARCEESKDLLAVEAPSRAARVEVRCAGLSARRDRIVLRITALHSDTLDIPIGVDPSPYWRPQEVLWAPNSSAFLVNGSENAYAGNAFIVHRLNSQGLIGVALTAAAQSDMVKTFPPCKASYLNRSDCQRIALDPQFNISAIAWTRDSNAVIVVAEVPCSSNYGGIMCQLMGYELEVPTGRILNRMTARELKGRYQSRMAWALRIPERPSFRQSR